MLKGLLQMLHIFVFLEFDPHEMFSCGVTDTEIFATNVAVQIFNIVIYYLVVP